jgi:hypothetical protein
MGFFLRSSVIAARQFLPHPEGMAVVDTRTTIHGLTIFLRSFVIAAQRFLRPPERRGDRQSPNGLPALTFHNSGFG